MWGIIIILWSYYRITFKTELPIWLDEWIAKPIVFLLPVIIYIKRYETGSILTAIGIEKKNLRTNILIGLAFGFLFLVTGLLSTFILLSHHLMELQVNLLAFIPVLLIAFASSFSEEILSRGFVLKRLYQDSNNAVTAVLYASILFFLLHIPILFTSTGLTGLTIVQVMITDFLLSVAVSILFLVRKSLIPVILVHMFYNAALYFFIR